MSNTGYRRSIVTFILIAAMFSSTAILYKYLPKFILNNFSLNTEKKRPGYDKNVNFGVVSNVGKNAVLKMDISIPVADKKQYKQLTQNLNRVKNDVLVSVNQEKMLEWVKNRNFPEIKKALLTIINRHSDRQIEEIYFDSFNFF